MKRWPAAILFVFLAAAALRAQATTAQLEANKPVTVPFELIQTKHIAVQIKINGKGPYRVIFDTGAPVTLLNTKIAKESGVLGKNAKGGGFGLFGMAGQAKIKELQVGDLKAADVPAIIMDHPTVDAISKALGPIEGIVGFPFFARYKMTLDYQAKEMTFVPNGFNPPDVMASLMTTIMAMMNDKQPPPKILAPAAQWGLVVTKKADDDEPGVTIKEVRSGSAAAAAGLKAGDRLLTLDGRWTDTVADTYTAAGFVKPGQAAKVVVKRGDKEIEVAVKPVSGI
jgi:hypothetical protein